MLTLRMYAAELAELPSDLDSALGELGEDYRRVLAAGVEAQAEVLGLSRELLGGRRSGRSATGAVVRFAELLATPAGVIGVHATEPRSERGGVRLQLYGVGSHEIAQFLYGLASSLSERYDIEISPQRHRSARFQALLDGGLRAASTPSPEELDAARLLSDPAMRSVARSIAGSDGGLLTSEISDQLEAGESRAGAVRASLESSRLVAAELVVRCTRSESQILRVPSRELLEQMASAGARCACGRSLLDEPLEEAVLLTERGRDLLSASRWMTLLLLSTLHALGIDYAAIALEPHPARGEADCFVEIDGALCLFELKDGEFDSDDARSLGAKLGRHEPEHAMLITTSSVDREVVEHLRRAPAGEEQGSVAPQAGAITHIEGIDGIVVDLGSLIESIYASHSIELLGQCLPFASLDAEGLVRALRGPEDSAEAPAQSQSRSRVFDRG